MITDNASIADSKFIVIEPVSGVTYTRWGHTSCPNSTGAELVYSGRAGGTHANSRGGAAQKLCLPDNPDYIATTAGISPASISSIHGAEYEFFAGPLTNVAEYNAPCAVCFVPTRATVIMIPAKTICPASWTREYYGYLTTNNDLHHRSSYTCLDISPGTIPGSGDNVVSGSAFFYYTVTTCNGLSCPPYENGRILSCVVCTK